LGDLSAPPALSLRGWGLKVLIRPPSAGWMREGDFPPLVTPMADEGEFTSVSFVTSSTLSKPTDFRSKDVSRGFTGNTLTPSHMALAPSSSRYVIDWGVVSHSVTHRKCRVERRCPTLYCYHQPHDGSRPIVHFIRALSINAVDKFFSKLTQSYRNSSIHLSTSYSQLSPRAKRKTLVRETRRALLGKGEGRACPRKPISVPADPKEIYPLYFGPITRVREKLEKKLKFLERGIKGLSSDMFYLCGIKIQKVIKG